MAKKKQQRKRSGPGRAGAGAGTSTATSSGGKAPVEATVKPTPATPGGPNRQERKEAARLARERLRRKAARRRLYRRLLIGLVVAAVVVGIVTLSTRTKGSALTAEERGLLTQATQAAQTAGCSQVQTIKPFSPDSQDRAHIGNSEVPTSPALSAYPSIPPASGPHNPTPLPAGVYSSPPDVYQTIHSLEHSAAVIWYNPDAASDPAVADELAKLQEFFGRDNEQTKVIVAPYNYPDQGAAGKLPEGKQMVLVAWHRMQTCDKVSLPVAFNFVAHYRFPAPKGEKYLGDGPAEERNAGI
jgi:Protein of unknown function (DUF3105)